MFGQFWKILEPILVALGAKTVVNAGQLSNNHPERVVSSGKFTEVSEGMPLKAD